MGVRSISMAHPQAILRGQYSVGIRQPATAGPCTFATLPKERCLALYFRVTRPRLAELFLTMEVSGSLMPRSLEIRITLSFLAVTVMFSLISTTVYSIII